MTDRHPHTDGLRPIGLPRAVRVQTDEAGLPSAVTLGGRGGARLAVERVEEAWRIAEEWWREAPLRRTYYRVIVEGGRPVTLFHDDLAAGTAGSDAGAAGSGIGAAGLAGGWYEQRY